MKKRNKTKTKKQNKTKQNQFEIQSLEVNVLGAHLPISKCYNNMSILPKSRKNSSEK